MPGPVRDTVLFSLSSHICLQVKAIALGYQLGNESAIFQGVLKVTDHCGVAWLELELSS